MPKKAIWFFIVTTLVILAGCGPKEQVIKPAGSLNFYNADLLQEWENIREQLDLSGTVKIEYFNLYIDSEGNFTRLFFDLIQRETDVLTKYSLYYMPIKDEISVNSYNIDEWIQFYRLAEADIFFSTLSSLELSNPLNSEFNHIFSTGEIVNYGMLYADTYLISEEGTAPLAYTSLPLQGFWFNCSWENRNYLYPIE